MVQKKIEIPLYTKIGFRVTVIIGLLICAMILRNCGQAVYYGSVTEQEEIAYYYQLGYSTGSGRSESSVQKSEIVNPLLMKAFRKGFREGRDATANDRNILRGKEYEKKE